MKYICDVCGWGYDETLGYPEGGIVPGTKWEDIPEDFECPPVHGGQGPVLCRISEDQKPPRRGGFLFACVPV